MTDAPDWVTLTDGEEIVWEGRPTVYPYLGGLATALVLVVVGAVVWRVADGATQFDVPGGLVGGLVVLVGLLVAANTLAKWWSVRYLITTEEVYKKRGLFSRTVQNIRLEQIQNTSFSQSALARLLSHGHVHIETAGRSGTEMTFRNVRHPEDVVAHLTRQLDRQYS